MLAVVAGEEGGVTLGGDIISYHNMVRQIFTVTVKIITRAFARRARFHGEGRWDGAGEERKVEVSVEETMYCGRVKCRVRHRCMLLTSLRRGMLDSMRGFVDAWLRDGAQHNRAQHECKLLGQG